MLIVLTENGIITSITSTIPTQTLPFIVAGCYLGVGTIGEKILDTANTKSEKMQEEIKNVVELEKIQNRNIALEKAIESLNSNQLSLSSLSNRYNISDKFAQ